LSRVARVAQR